MGLATIFLRGKVWWLRYRVQGQGGYERESLGTQDRDAAIAKAYDIVSQYQNHGILPSRRLTVASAIKEYLDDKATEVATGNVLEGIGAGRFGTIQTHLSHWQKFLGDQTPLGNLHLDSGKAFKRWRLDQGASLVTIRNEQASFNALVRWLYERNKFHLAKLNMSKIRAAEFENQDVRRASFTEEQAQRIRAHLMAKIKSAEQSTNGVEYGDLLTSCFFMLLLETGLRIGEALAMEWRDHSLEEKVITGSVPDSGSSVTNPEDQEFHSLTRVQVRAESSKVRKSRVVKFLDSSNFFLLLKMAQLRRYEETDGQFPKPESTSKIFRLNTNTPMSRRIYLKGFEKLLDDLGIQNKQGALVPYSFRHYYITRHINIGKINTMQLSAIAGTSEQQIRKTYFHLFDQYVEDAALAGVVMHDGILIEHN
ncbi:tyrosine-type recombinase/integrase [Spiribacter salilacus]|nr:tyrosine-type recombinase/integrase [Spiribacter salilacus]